MDNSSSGSDGPSPDQKNARAPVPEKPRGHSSLESDRAAPYAGSVGWRPPVPDQFAQPPFRPTYSEPPPPPPVPPLTFGLTPEGGFGDAPRTGGMLAASILLAISGFLSTFVFLIFLVFRRLSPVMDVLGVTGVADVVIAIGLFRGSRTFRIWALLRAVGCIVIFGLVVPLTHQVDASWPTAVLQIGLAIGLVILLLGERTSGWRIAAGIAVVLVSFVGAFGAGVVIALKHASFGKQLQGYISKDRAFVDDADGVRLDLPPGWLLLGQTNPMTRVLRAKTVAYHPQSGSYAAVLIEPNSNPSDSLDSYVTLLLKSRLRPGLGMEETGREPINFAGMKGMRLYTRSSGGLLSIKGYTSVCGDTFNHYVLYGWCSAFLYDQSYRAFQGLEKNFHITKSVDDRLDGRAAVLIRAVPYLSQASARRLAEYTIKLHYNEDNGPGQVIKSLNAFVMLLPASDQARFNAIFQQAFSTLPPSEAKLARADREDLEHGIPLGTQEAYNFTEMMSRAFKGLPASRMAEITKLADKAVDLGLGEDAYG
jgi:hypothetical protein